MRKSSFLKYAHTITCKRSFNSQVLSDSSVQPCNIYMMRGVPFSKVLLIFWVFFCREQYKSEYEMKLKGELDLITAKTNKELDGIRGDTKEMFERENRYGRLGSHLRITLTYMGRIHCRVEHTRQWDVLVEVQSLYIINNRLHL